MIHETTAEEKLSKELWAQRNENSKLRTVLRELFDAVENAILAARFVLYGGSVLGCWFYLGNRALAVAIAVSLTCAHGLIALREYVVDKKKEITA